MDASTCSTTVYNLRIFGSMKAELILKYYREGSKAMKRGSTFSPPDHPDLRTAYAEGYEDELQGTVRTDDEVLESFDME